MLFMLPLLLRVNNLTTQLPHYLFNNPRIIESNASMSTGLVM
jgi:hypothetical protein